MRLVLKANWHKPGVVALALASLAPGCRHLNFDPPDPLGPPPPRDPLPAGALLPSQNLLVGRLVAVDLPQGFAFVELSAATPPAALADGAEWIARTDDLRETARLRASRHLRGRLLGARIVSGQPAPGHEVVWPAP